MPRNSSGTHALPTGQPVISGTMISASTHNALAGDLSAEISSSLDRSGRGGMLAPLRVPDGSLPAPTLSFTNETGTGLRRAGTGDLRVGVLGADTLKVTASGADVLRGNVTLPAASSQSVLKSGGSLVLGTSDANDVFLSLGGTNYWQFEAATGNIKKVGPGTGTIQGLPTPTLADQAATKGYVDGLVVGSPVVSSSSGNFTTTSTSPTYVDVTNLSATITTRGRPVMLLVQPAGATGSTMANTTTTATLDIVIVRGATNIARWFLGAPYATAPQLQFLDVVAAGTYTYKVQAAVISGGTGYVTQYKLVAIEL
jgi:hypothetical protein